MTVTNPTPCVCGIDPSLTGLGLAFLWRDGRHDVRRLTSEPAHGVRERVQRITRLASQVAQCVADAAPVLVLLEGYAFGRLYNGHWLGELGGVLRARLCDLPPMLIEVPPAKLKQFASGKGNATKAVVAAALERRYGIACASSDETEAYGLACMAACHMGWVDPRGAHELAALAGLGEVARKPAPKRRGNGTRRVKREWMLFR